MLLTISQFLTAFLKECSLFLHLPLDSPYKSTIPFFTPLSLFIFPSKATIRRVKEMAN